jgi:hypothetical protein
MKSCFSVKPRVSMPRSAHLRRSLDTERAASDSANPASMIASQGSRVLSSPALGVADDEAGAVCGATRAFRVRGAPHALCCCF